MNERKELIIFEVFITFNTLPTEFASPKAAKTLILKPVTVSERSKKKTTTSLKLYGCDYKETAFCLAATYS